MVSGQPVCVYAMQKLKRNSTTLLIAMCIGIALALYGCYVQARSQSNPHYTSTIATATHWLYNNLGKKIMHPSALLRNCNGFSRGGESMSKARGFGHMCSYVLMRFLIKPMVQYSGIMNGMINIVQIILLKVYCKSVPVTDVIIALSGVGFAISMLCLIGSIINCKLMCFSCLGIHHLFIIFYGLRRRQIIKNLLCPTENTGSGNSNNSSSCSTGSGTNHQGMVFGQHSSIPKSGSSGIRHRQPRS